MVVIVKINKMNKKIIWSIVGFVALIVVLVGLKKAGVIGKEEGTEVTVENVQLRTITESVNASGKVYPEIEVKVSPDISGEITELTVQEGAMAKLFATEELGKALDELLQLYGGYGYMMEYPITRAFVDSRVTRIYGGTSEVMKELISRSL